MEFLICYQNKFRDRRKLIMQRHVKFIFNLAISIIFIFSFEGLSSAGSGLLISVNGKIEIVSGGKTTISKPGRALAPGDLVKSLGGSAVLVLASEKTQTKKASQKYKLSESTREKKIDWARIWPQR